MKDMLIIDDATCRIWFDGPMRNGSPSAAIGELRILDPAAGTKMLEAAVERLRAQGASSILAPMDGDTWHAYRSVVESDGTGPFPMEPVSGPHDVACLEAAGFVPVSRYVSTRMVLPDDSPRPVPVEGVSIVAWDGSDAEGLLTRLFSVASGSFADKIFFKPISEEAFLGLYRPLLAMVDPRLVLFAFDSSGSMVGFLFGIPDVAGDAAILKTYAATVRGVGRMLAARFHETARDMGFGHAVHALMHEDNVSLDRSGLHGAEVFRRYALFGRSTS
jgi:hypothetical protein